MKSIFKGPVFWGVTAAKLLAGMFFTSHFLSGLFIPFVRFFVDSGFANPWDEFLRRGVVDAFPYSTTMLALLALPQLVLSWIFGAGGGIPEWIQLFAMRLPLFAADVGIFWLLCRWFDGRRREILILYWCSPVLFYINYIHGQIDAIPTFFLMASLQQAIVLSPVSAGVLLAAGLGAKFHLAAAVPLVAAYLWKMEPAERRVGTVTRFLGAMMVGLAALIGPLVWSDGYRVLVLGAKETGWVYDLAWHMPRGMNLLICPLAVLALVLHYFSYHRTTKDVLILYTGLVYTVLITLVPPMPGWAYWSIPFLCYFLIRHRMTGYAPFWAFSGIYLVYYAAFAPGISAVSWLEITSSLPHGRDLVFTFMQTSLAMVVLWVYRVGVRNYVRYKVHQKVIAIGIGGDSASGKHTLAGVITGVLGASRVVRLHGDDYHRWPREHEAWKTQTHLDPRSNYFREPTEHVLELKSGSSIVKSTYDHDRGVFSEPQSVASNRFIVFEGLHPFVFKRMRDVFDLKIFLAPQEGLRRNWKVERDTAERGYTTEKVLSEIERRQMDSERFIRPQEAFADWVVEYRPAEDNGGAVQAVHRISSEVVEIEALVDALNQLPGGCVRVVWAMEPDLRRQVLEVHGSLSAQDVASIGQRLLSELQENLGLEPAWQADTHGVSQLVFLSILNSLASR